MSERETRAGAKREGPRDGGAAVAERSAPPKGIFLRTVYPLNPGIPHYLDFPQREG